VSCRYCEADLFAKNESHHPDCVVRLRAEKAELAGEVKKLRLDRAVLESIAKRPWADPKEAVAIARRALGLPPVT
jgi:lambda repressor-like predicted transcriptional regulator